jgi:hypothetical protein
MGNPPYYGTDISFLERRLQEPPCEPSRPSDASVPPVYKCSIINEIDSSIHSLLLITRYQPRIASTKKSTLSLPKEKKANSGDRRNKKQQKKER